MRIYLPERKPLYILKAEGCSPLQLYAHDFETAYVHQTWMVRAPDDVRGIILHEVVAMGEGRFAVLRQLRNHDDTEIVTAPEYFHYDRGKLFIGGVLEHMDEPEEAQRYYKYAQQQVDRQSLSH